MTLDASQETWAGVRVAEADHLPHEPVRLVPSAEPAVVFASLAAQCVPRLCDDCTIDIVEYGGGDSESRYRLVYPTGAATTGGMQRIAVRAAAMPDHRVRVTFTDPSMPDASAPTDVVGDGGTRFHGQALFVWYQRTPTVTDRALASALVTQALYIVQQQRSERAVFSARRAAAGADLRAALASSRSVGIAVGILMGRYGISEEQAVERLATAGRYGRRSLVGLALDVIEDRGLDPAPADPESAAPLTTDGKRG